MMFGRFICIMIISVLVAGCAKQTTPSGGEKDTIPPKLLQSNPQDRKTNFSSDEIELIFDEHIQVNNAREQIVITPTIGKKFEAIARKNKVILKLNADLSENTTYTFSFRESIQDLTEKNPAVNLKLAFSTGPFIDSLSIQGKVITLMDGKPVKNYTVAAFPNNDTTNIFKHEALWITFTNEKGEYSLENLKTGNYFIYTFDDKNKNLIVDSKSESYGFLGQPVGLLENQSNITLPVIRLDVRPLKLISAKPIATYFSIRASKGFSLYNLTAENSDVIVYSRLEDASTIRAYNTFPGIDSLLVRFQASDSIENKIDTLLYLKFDSRSRAKEKFTTTPEQVDFFTNSSVLKGVINFSKPVKSIVLDSIYIRLDSLNYIRFTQEDITWEKQKTKLILQKKLSKEIDFTQQPAQKIQPGQRKRSDPPVERNPDERAERKIILYNHLILPAATFISAENDSSASAQAVINTVNPESSGTIIVEVKTSEKVIIELLSRSNPTFRSTQHQSRFDNLPAGDYQIRVVIDKNGNGKWDPGNYYLRQEPEPILYYLTEKGNQSVSVKANWEIGPLLITRQPSVDN